MRTLANIQRRLIASLPLLLGILFVLLGAVPIGLPYFSVVAPLFIVAAVFYWSIYRPESFTAVAAFTVGLIHDVLSGGPLGLMALILTITHLVIVGQRRVFLSKSFAVGWWGFSLVVASVLFVAWLVVSLLHGAAVAPQPMVVQFGLTVMLYPALNWLFNRTETLMLRQA